MRFIWLECFKPVGSCLSNRTEKPIKIFNLATVLLVQSDVKPKPKKNWFGRFGLFRFIPNAQR
ncbi:BnaC04g55590D [Brassica napus]|uniref:Uncharacterized protein n=2 Tax=Brassica TaxID=3705 RepID=A0A0D3BXP4_BRAOL|nr:unnamed protein product [Brassica napus]CDY65770.1 BnaC04g55590D [Brassica napus]